VLTFAGFLCPQMSAAAAPASSASKDELVARISNSKPALRDAHDAVAFVVHTLMLDAGWKCVALDEKTDEKDCKGSLISLHPFRSCSCSYTLSTHKKDLGSVPSGWNQSSDAYSFVYHLQHGKPSGSGSGGAAASTASAASSSSASSASSTLHKAVVKLVRMENALLVHAVRKSGDDKKVHSAELKCVCLCVTVFVRSGL
jgi:hypothetical protein